MIEPFLIEVKKDIGLPPCFGIYPGKKVMTWKVLSYTDDVPNSVLVLSKKHTPVLLHRGEYEISE